MGRSFKNYRSKLQEHFLKCHGEEDVERAKGLKPTDSNINDDAWHKLCDYWSSEEFQVSSFWIPKFLFVSTILTEFGAFFVFRFLLFELNFRVLF